MIKTLSTLIFLFLFLMQSAYAKKEFQYAIEFEKSSINNNNSQQSNNTVTFRYFRKPLINGNYPYAEASFIDRNSSLAFSTDYIFLNFASDNITSKNAAVFAQFNEKERSVTFSVFYLNMRGNGDVANELINSKNQILYTDIGWYVSKNTQFIASYSKMLSKETRDDELAFDGSSNNYSVYFNHLFSFSNKHYLKIMSTLRKITSVDDNYTRNIRRIFSTYDANLSANYYFSKSFSFRVLGARNRILNPARDGGWKFAVKLMKYYTPYTSMDFEIAEYKADNGKRDSNFDILAFGISHRF